jgi:hypothetical protein
VILCDKFGQTIKMKVVDLSNTFLRSTYPLILVGYSESGEF